MKKILYAAVLTAGVLNAEQEEIKLSGLYLGAGVNVNHDVGKVNIDELGVNGVTIPPAQWPKELSSANFRGSSVNYGGHFLVGGNYQFNNRLFVGFEQQAGLAYHPAETRMIKPWEFTTLAKFGYAFESFPGVIYVSGGIKFLGIRELNKNLVRPVFGIGYQHGISQHWSIKGDVLYTHINSFKHTTKTVVTRIPISVKWKCKGHRLSGAITFVYTF